MNRWHILIAIAGLTILPAMGCGVRELGPANPEDTPKVEEEDIQKQIQQSMPEEYRKQYQQ